jgi:hypothetical protein
MSTSRPAHLIITRDDTVTVEGMGAGWVVGAVRAANPSSNRADMREVQLLVSRVRGRREVQSEAAWVSHRLVRLERKGNADSDLRIRLFGDDPCHVPHAVGLGATVGGYSSGEVVSL